MVSTVRCSPSTKQKKKHQTILNQGSTPKIDVSLHNLEQDVDYLQQDSFVTCIHMNEIDKRNISYTTQLRHLTKPAVPKRVHFLPLQIGALSTKDRSVSPVDCTA